MNEDASRSTAVSLFGGSRKRGLVVPQPAHVAKAGVFSGALVPPRPNPARVWSTLTALDEDTLRSGRGDLADPVADGAAVAALDVLRTRLLQALADNAWTRIAVTAPRRGCGTTFVAINLALSVARVRSVRAVLVDLDLRKPDMAARFGVSDAGSLAAFLAADQPVEAHLRRHGRNLALGLNSEPVMASAELLQQPETAETLEDMIDSLLPDIVLYDLPPVLEGDDLLAFLPQVDGVLLVADGTRTVAKDLAECERLLEGRAPLIGVVLNRGELRRGDLHARTGE